MESGVVRNKSPGEGMGNGAAVGEGGMVPPAFVIGIAGGSGSGKTSLCQQILRMLPNQRVAIVSQDCFYRNLTPEESKFASHHNFDDPGALDWKLNYEVLSGLRQRKRVLIPSYDYVTHSRKPDGDTPIWNIDVVLFEGILSFYEHPEYSLSPLMDLKIFVETDSDTRLARRVFRDTQHRGRTLDSVLVQYERFVKPAYEQFIYPLRRCADVIIPWGDYSGNLFSDNGKWQSVRYPALDMIVDYIQGKLAAVAPPRKLSPTPSCSWESIV